MAMTTANVRELLTGPSERLQGQAFEVLASIAAVGASGQSGIARDLLIRALDRLDDLAGTGHLLDALVRQHGLFPYLSDPANLGTADKVAYEVHRPLGVEDLVFHAEQAEVYRLLAD